MVWSSQTLRVSFTHSLAGKSLPTFLFLFPPPLCLEKRPRRGDLADAWLPCGAEGHPERGSNTSAVFLRWDPTAFVNEQLHFTADVFRGPENLSSLNINYVLSFSLSDTSGNQTPSPSACGIIRRFTRSKELGSWAASAFCPTLSTALKTQAVSVSDSLFVHISVYEIVKVNRCGQMITWLSARPSGSAGVPHESLF